MKYLSSEFALLSAITLTIFFNFLFCFCKEVGGGVDSHPIHPWEDRKGRVGVDVWGGGWNQTFFKVLPPLYPVVQVTGVWLNSHTFPTTDHPSGQHSICGYVIAIKIMCAFSQGVHLEKLGGVGSLLPKILTLWQDLLLNFPTIFMTWPKFDNSVLLKCIWSEK